MGFSEFLLALGFKKAAEICNNPVSDVSESVHEFLIEQLRIYWIVGGMPECIEVYKNSKSIKLSTEVQDEIIETYQLDFSKYRPKTDIHCLKTVFSAIASNAGQEFASATKRQLYYWSRDSKNSNAEVDFLLQVDNDFIPVEVKDGPSGKLKSLHLFRSTYQPGISVVFHSGIMGKLTEENIVFLPLYFAGAFARFGIQDK